MTSSHARTALVDATAALTAAATPQERTRARGAYRTAYSRARALGVDVQAAKAEGEARSR